MTNNYLERKTHQRHPAWGATWGFLLPMFVSFVAGSIILSLFGVQWLVCCTLSKSVVSSYSRSWMFLLSRLARFVTFGNVDWAPLPIVCRNHLFLALTELLRCTIHLIVLSHRKLLATSSGSKYCSVSDFLICTHHHESSTNNQNPGIKMVPQRLIQNIPTNVITTKGVCGKLGFVYVYHVTFQPGIFSTFFRF